MKTARKPKAKPQRKTARPRKVVPVPRTPTDAEIIRSLEDNAGLPYRAATKLKCPPLLIHARAKDNPDIASLISDRHARLIDVAEAKLFEALNKGETWAVTFTLSRLAKQTYGPDELPPPPSQQIPAQQNVFILNREAANNLPIEALRAVVETVRHQRRAGPALPAPTLLHDENPGCGPEGTAEPARSQEIVPTPAQPGEPTETT